MKPWQIATIAGVLLVAVVAGGVFMLGGSGGGSAATVNGVKIPESEVEDQLAIIREQQQGLFDGPDGKEQEARFRVQVVDFLVSAELIKQEADKLGIKVSDKDVAERYEQVKGLFPDKKQFDTALKDQNLTEDGLRDKIREQVVSDKMMERVAKDIKITNKDKKKYFDANEAQFVEAEQRHWFQIVSKSKKDAAAILADLKGGADFEKLAKEKSTDKRTAAEGGDMGWAGPSDFPPEIAEVLNKLKVDELSKVVEAGPDQFVVFRLDGTKPEKQMAYNEVKDQVDQILMREEQQAKFSALIERLKKEAKITKN